MEREVYRWEWAVTILGDIAAIGALAFGYIRDDSFLLLAGLVAATFTIGFGHAVKRDRKT